AVVADEVRSLAQRTGESTGQIHQLIAKLQRTAEEAVVAMQIGRSQADEGVKQVLLADQALMGISDSVENIAGMADQIAAAAEEQSAVADEINRNITNIAQLSDQTAEDAQQTARLSQALTGNAKGQQSLVERFNR
ncbi:MAG TPA: chemotaxis protein, partial [Pseudomonas sp.]|nr:chemotaxis protein [Pseudomonas sp.]